MTKFIPRTQPVGLRYIGEFGQEFEVPAHTLVMPRAHVVGVEGGFVKLAIPNSIENADVLDALAMAMRGGLIVDVEIHLSGADRRGESGDSG